MVVHHPTEIGSQFVVLIPISGKVPRISNCVVLVLFLIIFPMNDFLGDFRLREAM